MKIGISYARGRLTHLIRHAEAGNDVVLTQNGVAVARLVALESGLSDKDITVLDAAENRQAGAGDDEKI